MRAAPATSAAPRASIRSPYADVVIPKVALTPFVLHRAAELGDKPALVCGASGRRYTYAELSQSVRRAAAGLHARGVRKGDVVGIVSPNVPEFAIAFHGAALVGAIVSTVNPVATADEIATQFSDSEAKCIITVPLLLEKCLVAARSATSVRDVFVFGDVAGAVPFADLLQHGDVVPDVPIDPTVDLVALPYSSGTSGIPKGVMLTHYNLVANIAQVAALSGTFVEDDVVLAVLPFFHIYGLQVILHGALHAGATLVSLPRFELETCLQVMQDHRVTYANVVPPIVLALAKHPIVDTYDLSALHSVFSGAAPLGRALAAECEARIGARVRQGYGLTETSPVTHIHPFDAEIVAHDSVGPVVANTECRLTDPDTGHDVPVGKRGELWVRGPQVMAGYFNKPAATADCLTPDGWFRTGDVATVDEHGWFRIVDRVKELIKYKGLQVAPAELEAVLLSHPAIVDAAVIPVPDDEAGEVPKAFVVLRADLAPETIMAFVAERVSPYKKIRMVEVVDTIPKSASGKILRRVLVEQERAKRV